MFRPRSCVVPVVPRLPVISASPGHRGRTFRGPCIAPLRTVPGLPVSCAAWIRSACGRSSTMLSMVQADPLLRLKRSQHF